MENGLYNLHDVSDMVFLKIIINNGQLAIKSYFETQFII